MKKTLIALFAFAALTGTAYANRDSDLRDSDTYFGKYSAQLKNKFNESTSTVVSPLALTKMKLG
jgi:hypothetical protein